MMPDLSDTLTRDELFELAKYAGARLGEMGGSPLPAGNRPATLPAGMTFTSFAAEHCFLTGLREQANARLVPEPSRDSR